MEWLKEYWLTFLIYFVVINLFAVVLTFFIVLVLPDDYLVRDYKPKARPFIAPLRNALGGLLILAGVLMMFLPGPGFLTVFCGLVILHSSQKQKLLIKVVKFNGVEKQIQQIRKKFGKTKLVVPEAN